MIFMVLVGGLGTFEGPILGAIVFFVIQNQFGDQGVWYLVGLGMARDRCSRCCCRAASGAPCATGSRSSCCPSGTS